jgi:hypothetical protein
MAAQPRIDMNDPAADILIEAIWDRPSTPKNMTGRFRSVILTYSDSPELEIAITEWRLHRVSDAQDVSAHCICSHLIHNEYYIILYINQRAIFCALGPNVSTNLCQVTLKQTPKSSKNNWHTRRQVLAIVGCALGVCGTKF